VGCPKTLLLRFPQLADSIDVRFVFSSSVTTVGVSCTSMSQSIRQACGSSSSCEKHFHFGSAPRFVIFDRDAKYGLEVPTAVRSLSVNPLRTSFESPWQNGVAERWVGSCRRDLLDHIIAVDEGHLKRRLSEYIRYYHHEDRTHLGLGKGTPDGRTRTIASGRVLSHMRVGGLHHRYDRAA
jgi:hypothetical protein